MSRPIIRGRITAVDFTPDDGVLLEVLAEPGSAVAAGRYTLVPDEGTTTFKVTWAQTALQEALDRLISYRETGSGGPAWRLHPDEQAVMVAIDTLRAVLAANGD